ncbi:phosphate transport system permease protein [Granulimonas faecalis]|uniref:Phosphate transport system permease protein n=1 Tax=Granulimonas faecalis TaxID=2894155 RepID=A0AAV5AY99_9ACTN|nr:phosphate ABC transporter permease subunit PstC [Granulimonas faecalis]GJM54682.1 phosphate transport system permease protein [Granulimonas faecalis]
MKTNILKERAARAVFGTAALVSVAAVALICIFLFANGIPAMARIGLPDFLLGSTWKPTSDLYGIFPMLVGSVYVTAGALVVGVPAGVLTAVYLSQFASGRLSTLLKGGIDLLAGIPSVVYGFFGLMVLVPFIRTEMAGRGLSLLAASVLLGIMILPTVVTVSKNALDAVPESYYQGAVSVGASHERAVFTVVVPAAASGILASVVLGVGRAMGETMAVVMVAGNQPQVPGSVFDGVRTLTANIVLEMGYAADLHRGALIATGVVLFVLVMLVCALFHTLKTERSAQ